MTCICACHENKLKKPYLHDTECCKNMNGNITEYERGFIAGSDLTGSIAEETHAIELELQRKFYVKELTAQLKKINKLEREKAGLIKQLLEDREDIIKKIDILITKEIVTAQKEGEKTSRLTSLANKLETLLN